MDTSSISLPASAEGSKVESDGKRNVCAERNSVDSRQAGRIYWKSRFAIKYIDFWDIDKIKDLCYELFSQNKDPGRFNFFYFEKFWSTTIKDKVGIGFVAYENDEPIGGIFGVLSHCHMTNDVLANECHWIVRKGCVGAGMMLMERFIKWAKEQKVHRIILGGDPHHAKAYNRLGFKPWRMKYYMEMDYGT